METLRVILGVSLVYLPPIYLSYRFFYKRGLKKWAWWTWAASLYGPVGYVVFAIGYWMAYKYQENCPECGMKTPTKKKSVTNEQGETLTMPTLAWAGLVGGGVLSIIGLIMVVALIFGNLSGYGAVVALVFSLGTSSLSWGFTQIQKFNNSKENQILHYSFNCSGCGHSWEQQIPRGAMKIAT